MSLLTLFDIKQRFTDLNYWQIHFVDYRPYPIIGLKISFDKLNG